MANGLMETQSWWSDVATRLSLQIKYTKNLRGDVVEAPNFCLQQLKVVHWWGDKMAAFEDKGNYLHQRRQLGQ